MEYYSETEKFLNGLTQRFGNLAAEDLRRLAQTANSLPRANAKIRRRLNEIIESMGGNIQSRLDSHHWDRGFCEIESAAKVIYAAEGHVLCAECGDNGKDLLHVYSPEEVRETGGARHF